MKKLTLLSRILMLVAVMYSCVPLNHVSEYASNALNGLTAYEQLSLDFEKACRAHCLVDKLDSLNMYIDNCDCRPDHKADSITLLLYNALKGYFDGLASLADNELTTYKMDELSKALAGNEFGKIQLSEEQAGAYAAISGILLKAITDEYRKKRIGTYVQEADGSVAILIDWLDFNIAGNLQGKINVLQDKYRSYTKEILRDTTVSKFDKRAVLLVYWEKTGETEKWKEEIVAYSHALQKIKEGHHELAENAANLKAGEVKKALLQYASDIDNIISEINKLKTK